MNEFGFILPNIISWEPIRGLRHGPRHNSAAMSSGLLKATAVTGIRLWPSSMEPSGFNRPVERSASFVVTNLLLSANDSCPLCWHPINREPTDRRRAWPARASFRKDRRSAFSNIYPRELLSPLGSTPLPTSSSDRVKMDDQ